MNLRTPVAALQSMPKIRQVGAAMHSTQRSRLESEPHNNVNYESIQDEEERDNHTSGTNQTFRARQQAEGAIGTEQQIQTDINRLHIVDESGMMSNKNKKKVQTPKRAQIPKHVHKQISKVNGLNSREISSTNAAQFGYQKAKIEGQADYTVNKNAVQETIPLQRAGSHHSRTDSDWTEKTKKLSNRVKEVTKGPFDKATLPKQVSKMQSQAQIRRVEMVSSDYGYTESGVGNRATKFNKNHYLANPFGTQGRRSPTSGQQQYDSDGTHGHSESASLREAELAGSIAAATEITRDLLGGRHVSKELNTIDTEPLHKDTGAIQHQEKHPGKNRTQNVAGQQAQALIIVEGGHAVDSDSDVTQKFDELSITERTLGHASSSQRESQPRDGPDVSGVHQSRGSMVTVHQAEEVRQSVSMFDLTRQEPPETLSVRRENRENHQNQTKQDGLLDIMNLVGEPVGTTQTFGEKPPVTILKPNAQAAGILNDNKKASEVGQERELLDTGPGQLARGGKSALTLGQGKGATSSAVSLLQLSRGALQSSQGRLNEADLISSPPASQGDYMADRSSRATATKAEKAPSATLQLLSERKEVAAAVESSSPYSESHGSSRAFLHTLICGPPEVNQVQEHTPKQEEPQIAQNQRNDMPTSNLTYLEKDQNSQVQSQKGNPNKQHKLKSQYTSQHSSMFNKHINSKRVSISSNRMKIEENNEEAYLTNKNYEIVKYSLDHIFDMLDTKLNQQERNRKEALALAEAELAYGFDQEQPGFEGSRAEGRKWAETNIEQIQEKGSREEQSTIALDTLQPVQDQKRHTRNVSQLQEPSRDESRYVTQDGGESAGRSQSGLLCPDIGEKEYNRAITDRSNANQTPDLINGLENHQTPTEFRGNRDNRAAVELDRVLDTSVRVSNGYSPAISKLTKTVAQEPTFNSSRKVLNDQNQSKLSTTKLGRPALTTTAAPIINIEANLSSLGHYLSYNKAVQQMEIVPQKKTKAVNISNSVEAEVKMFEEGAWQADSAVKWPKGQIKADELKDHASMRLSNAWTQNQSQQMNGSVRSSARHQSQVRKSLEQQKNSQLNSPKTKQGPPNADEKAQRIEKIADYYHRQNQIMAASPSNDNEIKLNESDLLKDSRASRGQQYATLPNSLGRPFGETPVSPIGFLPEVEEEAHESSRKRLQKLAKLKKPAQGQGIRVGPNGRGRRQPQSGFEPEKPTFGASAMDTEFVRKYKVLKATREADESSPDGEGQRMGNNGSVLRVGDDFILSEFLRGNKIEGLLGREKKVVKPISELNSGIHGFHKQSKGVGGMRNRLPGVGAPGVQGFDYMSRIREKNAKALLQTRGINVEAGHYAAKALRKAHVHTTKGKGSNKHLSLDSALQAGLIDIDKAYLLIQFIQKAHGQPTMTDAKIHAILRTNSMGRVSRERSSSQLQGYKWGEVMKFMQANPHVLMQLLASSEQPEAQKQPAKGEQFFARRPRYTDKILQSIHHGLPGLIGSLKPGAASGVMLPSHAPYAVGPGMGAPKVLQGRNIHTLSNAQEHPSIDFGTNLPHSQDKRQKKGIKSTNIEQRPRGKGRNEIEFKSFSPPGGDGTFSGYGVPDLDQSSGEGGGSEPMGLPKPPKGIHRHQKKQIYTKPWEQDSSWLPSEPGVPRGKTQLTRKKIGYPSQKGQEGTFGVAHLPGTLEPRKPQELLRAQFHSEGPGSSMPKIEKHRQIREQFPTRKYEAPPAGQDFRSASNEEQISIQIDRVRPMYEDQFPESQPVYIRQQDQDAMTAPKEEPPRSPYHPHTKELRGDMKMMAQNMDLRKPKTNEAKRRAQTKSYDQPDDMFHSQFVRQQNEQISPGPLNGNQVALANAKSANYSQSPIVTRVINDQRSVPKHQAQAVSHLIDQRTEITSRGSVVFSRFEELANQKKALEAEEAELSRQRGAIVEERDKVTRQLRRLERKEELVAREDQVKKQRLILELEKKRLREDIAELDSLKYMLEGKKKDTQTGFHDLAESNKELRSLKSGDLRRDRSAIMSKQSTHSRRMMDSKGVAGSQTPHTLTEDALSRNHRTREEARHTAAIEIRSQERQPSELENFQRSRTPGEMGSMDVARHEPQPQNHMMHDFTRSPDLEPSKPTNTSGADPFRRSGPNETDPNARLVSAQQRARNSVFEAYRPSPSQTLGDDVERATHMQKTKSNGRIKELKQLASPKSHSNATFLSGTGVFDWAQSRLMEDVLNKKTEFVGTDFFYSESEVYDLIENVKASQKLLRGPEKMRSVYRKAFDTLQELMVQMNQQILFQMIAKKYNDVNLDNTVKLLVRCKQLLVSRKLAFATLQGIADFEKSAKRIRRDVDAVLEATPSDDLIASITKEAEHNLPTLVQSAITNIATLRDQHKLFSKMGATTSKGNQVLNVMAYKRRDAMRYLLREYEAIKRLVQVVDIIMPQINKA